MNLQIKSFKDWGFFYKILGIILVSIVSLILLIVLYILPTMRSNIMEEKQVAVRNIVKVGYDIVQYYESKASSSEMTVEDAKNSALKELAKVRYGDNDYFWINDLSHNMIMHAAKPELNGTSMYDFKDPNDKYVFREFVSVVKQSGDGFVEYFWPKPGYDEPLPKVSYVKLFEKWGWVLGSGIYVNDVDEEFAEIKQRIYLTLFGLVAGIFVISYFFAKKMVKPINTLKEAADKIVSGDLNVSVEVNSNDEIGKLSNSFNFMSEKISQQIQHLDNLTNPVMIIDPDFNIQYMNKKGAEVLGKSQKELIGQKCYDNFKTGHCKTENCALYKAMKNDRIFTEETVAHPNGMELPILYSGSPIKNRQGKIVGALELVTPIKEIKDLQSYLTRSTNTMMRAMEQFEKGDLTVNITPEKEGDDIAKLYLGFNKSIQNIKGMLNQVLEAVQATASASTQISSSTEELAAGAQEQSVQITEVASAVEEMTKTIIETTTNSSRASETAKTSGNIAQDGGKVVSETIAGMNKIAEVVTQAAETVKELGSNSDKIGEIIQVIDDIADQTNLLALNAAIEAARAGEQGRGFAVVADEVRKLAERTTKATKEIAAMIKQIQKDTSNAVVSMEKGMEEVNSGKHLAEKAGESLNQIISSSKEAIDNIAQVAAASEEQSSAAEQISKNVESISSVTQQSAAGTQQIARAAEDLNRLTDNLQNLVNRFKIDDGDNKTHYSVRQNGKLIEV
jgi:methyl-accepting chemotaxis protein